MIDHIVFIGINYQQKRSSGDKNFWIDIIQQVSIQVSRITILCIRDDFQQTESFKINECDIIIHYIKPKLLESPDTKHTWKRIFWNGGAFPRGFGVIEKILNVRSILKKLHRLHLEHPYDHIHLMDNFGFGNPLIAANAHTSVSVSAMAYQGGKYNLIYNLFLKLCYSHANLTVVPYSMCYKEKLVNIGLSVKRICHIHWGVIPSNQTKANRPAEKPLILWTGYIQQIKRVDFLYALRIAHLAIEQGIQASFYFAFKPESFEAGFEQCHDPENGITVKTTTVQEFAELRKNVAIMFSPVVGRSTILAPPLSWLEMLNAGVPIVTSDVPGASEAVIDGVTGCIANTEEELVSALFNVVGNYKVMGDSCRQHISKNYDIESCTQQYLELWGGLVTQRGQLHEKQ
jgi:hypothetical protein